MVDQNKGICENLENNPTIQSPLYHMDNSAV